MRALHVIVVVTCLVSSSCMLATCQELSPNAPPDHPLSTNHRETQKFEQAIAPYVAKARATLPAAKKRYLDGLGAGEIFFVTTRLYGPDGRFEQVFMRVTSWTDNDITGVLASDTSLVEPKRGSRLTCKERDVLDWTISKPDGSEEGNFVGNFLESHQP